VVEGLPEKQTTKTIKLDLTFKGIDFFKASEKGG
jgi:hypothetical protein